MDSLDMEVEDDEFEPVEEKSPKKKVNSKTNNVVSKSDLYHCALLDST